MALDIIRQGEAELKGIFDDFAETAYANQEKVLETFKNFRVREDHFQPSSGYGYDDEGREVLENIYAEVFGTEDALLRTQIVSGTHAISACLFALLKPGDTMLAVSGRPYDTLANVIGLGLDKRGTLTEKGVNYREISLLEDGRPDLETIRTAVNADTRLVFIQRSRGYQLRPALSISAIQKICEAVKAKNPSAIIMADNCYGEFTSLLEPAQVGVHLTAGSLIKNPGGGLAPNGGYIAGPKDLIEQIAWHLTAPGLGKKLGATLINRRYFFMGLFTAPHAVLQSLMGAALTAWVAGRYNYRAFPEWDGERGDIVQAVQLNTAEQVSGYCRTVQAHSPVDSYVTPEFAPMPGYDSKVIMAAGTFIQGSSLELSCDAPLRSPYCVFTQGGLTYQHCRLVVKKIIESGIF
ncbi:MAG: methionine gamma-lyase family protein [Syntrophomonadaceae bacterium]|nr:methionine gamma-lyase family protein [Syntrophomonadaceae bacterium]